MVTQRGFKSLLIFNIYGEVCLGFLVDTMFCVKWLAILNIFIILVLVSEFVVMAIL